MHLLSRRQLASGSRLGWSWTGQGGGGWVSWKWPAVPSNSEVQRPLKTWPLSFIHSTGSWLAAVSQARCRRCTQSSDRRSLPLWVFCSDGRPIVCLAEVWHRWPRVSPLLNSSSQDPAHPCLSAYLWLFLFVFPLNVLAEDLVLRALLSVLGGSPLGGWQPSCWPQVLFQAA